MVSVQAALSPCADLVFLTKKRKRGDGEDHAEALFAEETKPVKAEEKEEEIELNLDAPLPLDWQRCLDIKVNTCGEFVTYHYSFTTTSYSIT